MEALLESEDKEKAQAFLNDYKDNYELTKEILDKDWIILNDVSV